MGAAFVSKYNAANTFGSIALRTAGTADIRANPTLAAGDVKISKDGGAFANLTTLPSAVPASGKNIEMALSATELSCSRAVIHFIDQTNPKEWDDFEVLVLTYGNVSAQWAPDYSDSVRMGMKALGDGFKTVTWIDTTDTAKTVIEAAAAGTLCMKAPGVHAVGNNTIYVPADVSVRGSGRDTTKMTCSYTAGVAFRPGTRSRISDFTFNMTAAGIPVGADFLSGAFQDAVFERFKISSTTSIDGIYISNGIVCSGALRDVVIESPFDNFVLAGAVHKFNLFGVWINGQEASNNDTMSGIRIQGGGLVFGNDVHITLRTGTGTTALRCLDIQDAGSQIILHNSSLDTVGTPTTTNRAADNTNASIVLVNCEFDRTKTNGVIVDILNPTAAAIRQEMDANSQIAIDAGQGRSNAATAAINTIALLAAGTGTGDTIVNQDTGGTDHLRFTTAGGAGIDNATVLAYLKTEYDANAATATRRAQVFTKADGRWAEPMMLNAGLTYTFVFSASGFQSSVVEQAV